MIRLPVKTTSQRPELFKAAWPVELINTMPALNYDATHPRRFTRLAHVFVPGCKEGDILDCSATVQISNNLGELVEYSAALVATAQSSGVAGIADPFNLSNGTEPPDGKFVTRFPGFNVTTNPGGMHHAPLSRHGRFLVPASLVGDLYIAFIGYAAGLTFDATRTVSVDAWCGDISVIRFS